MEELLNFISSFFTITESSWNALAPILIQKEFKKGAMLLHIDDVCDSLYFIVKGHCRAFTIQDDCEVNISFYFEGDIATNINSYIFGTKSTLTIEACEALTVIKFNKEQIRNVSTIAPEIELIAKRNLQFIAAKQEKQLELYRLLTARQRYEYIEKNQPELLQRVSLSMLSSYLGVKRETLSRIRNKRRTK